MKEFNAEAFLQQFADSLGLSYDEVAQSMPFAPLVVTGRMVKLALSRDRRKRKKGWRLYFDLNGRSSSHGYFWSILDRERFTRTYDRQKLANALYQQWLDEQQRPGAA